MARTYCRGCTIVRLCYLHTICVSKTKKKAYDGHKRQVDPKTRTVATSPIGRTSTLLPARSPPCTARAATTTFLPAWEWVRYLLLAGVMNVHVICKMHSAARCGRYVRVNGMCNYRLIQPPRTCVTSVTNSRRGRLRVSESILVAGASSSIASRSVGPLCEIVCVTVVVCICVSVGVHVCAIPSFGRLPTNRPFVDWVQNSHITSYAGSRSHIRTGTTPPIPAGRSCGS